MFGFRIIINLKPEYIMKIKIILLVVFLLFAFTFVKSEALKSGELPVPPGSINIFVSQGLLSLSANWADEFTKANPTQKITVVKSSEQEILRKIISGEGLGFIDSKSFSISKNSELWNMVVGRDVIVPVMNASSPCLDNLYKSGLSVSVLADLVQGQESRIRRNTSLNSFGEPLRIYSCDDLSVRLGLAGFLQTDQSEINKGVEVSNIQQMISALQKDPNGIGFCKLIQVTDLANHCLIGGLQLVPIDVNGNGKLDYMENIYSNLQSFSRGVWIGKYPKSLSNSIYAISCEKPKSPGELVFLQWILKNGQQYLSPNGFSDLVYADKQSQFKKLEESPEYASVPVESSNTFMASLLIIILLIITGGIFTDLAYRFIRSRKNEEQKRAKIPARAFDEDSLIMPKGLYFDKTHTWSFMKKNGAVKIGIDDFLQHITGEITRVEVKTIGEKIKKGDFLFSIIRKGKQLNIYSPASGTIIAINKNLERNSSLLNSSPYDNGWVYEIEPLNWSLEIQYLSIAEQYKVLLKDEFLRLKEFFNAVANTDLGLATIVVQDGGAISDKPLAELSPEVWDDFQTKFLDLSR